MRITDLYIAKIFLASPLMAMALCVSMATILWCILLARRQRSGVDKVLTGLLGLIAIYQSIRILKEAGFLLFPGVLMRTLDGWADFIIASLCLVAALILKVSSIDRTTTKVRLRLVEANEKPLDLARSMSSGSGPDFSYSVLDASPLATFAVDLYGTVNYWNTAAETMTGLTRDEMLGHRLPFGESGPILNKDGQEVDSVLWTVPVQGANGVTRGTLMFAASGAALREAGIGRSTSRRRSSLLMSR